MTFRRVKSLSVASTALCGAIIGLTLIFTPARILKPDMVSFLALSFASLFGLVMKVIEEPDGFEWGASSDATRAYVASAAGSDPYVCHSTAISPWRLYLSRGRVVQR